MTFLGGYLRLHGQNLPQGGVFGKKFHGRTWPFDCSTWICYKKTMKKAIIGGIALLLPFLLVFPGRHEPEESVRRFQHIFELINDRHPGPPDQETMVYASIHGLLQKLDPHSRFLDPPTLRATLEDQKGNYYGIGIRITRFEDRLTIVSTMAGMPAAEAGLRAGDIISAVEGRPTSEMRLEEAMNLLRGKKGSSVNLSVKREGIAAELPFSLRRAPIPLHSIGFALLHPEDERVAYISLQSFSRTTRNELQNTLDRLRALGARSLILDLRGNPGGSLQAAIETADLFLPAGRVIVSVRSRGQSSTRYAEKEDLYENMPIVVLINRGSASASEIVAAALQENERALVIGRRSWGKGLVETLFNLSLGSALALTTARYYTPADNSLQRDFSSFDDYFYFLEDEDYDRNDSIQGGVIPDILVAPRQYPPGLVGFGNRGLFFSFALASLEIHPVTDSTFRADDGMLADFMAYAAERGFSPPDAGSAAYGDLLKEFLTREILALAFGAETAMLFALEHDAQAARAREYLTPLLEADRL